MARLSISELPGLVRWGLVAAYFTAFVCFEEFVIDRHHWDRFLPLYRVGDLCVYDVLALAAIVLTVFRPWRRTTPRVGGNSGAT